jgi:hypothetical protein
MIAKSPLHYSIGNAFLQQSEHFIFAILAIIVTTKSIMDTIRFIPYKTVDKRFGTLYFNESYKSSDSEVMRRSVHVLAAGELVALPTPP